MTNLLKCNGRVPFKPKSVPEIVAQMKQEILADMRSDRFTVRLFAFSDLHDFVDANCYGGFCDDDFSEGMIQYFGGRDEHDGMPQAYIDLMNACQKEVHDWLESGQHHKEYAELFPVDEIDASDKITA